MFIRNLKKESVIFLIAGSLSLLSIGNAAAAPSNDMQPPMMGQQQMPMRTGQEAQQQPIMGQAQQPMMGRQQQGRPLLDNRKDDNMSHSGNPETHHIPHSFFTKMNKYNQELAHLHFQQMKLMREGKTEEAQSLNNKIRSVQEELMAYQRER